MNNRERKILVQIKEQEGQPIFYCTYVGETGQVIELVTPQMETMAAWFKMCCGEYACLYNNDEKEAA